MEFSKYHGLGNDFVLVDNRHQVEPTLTPEQAVAWCDRHFGNGAGTNRHGLHHAYF